MDVHAPNGSIHTWKDFWIHLGTIAIGLLIAIALEQSVEALHRVHERHVLEADLRTEGQRDLILANADMRNFDIQQVWLLALRNDVDRMRASGGKVKLLYRAAPPFHNYMPSDAVWSTAKESGLIVLLPREEAEVYARLYRQHDMLNDAISGLLTGRMELKTFENRFDDAGPRSDPDLSRMDTEELGEYSALLTKTLTMRNNVQGWLQTFIAADRAVLQGTDSETEMLKAIGRR